jgi:hypothetical protein
MLSFASAAFTENKQLVGTFEANLEALPGAEPDPETLKWWKTKPEAWAACRANLRPPKEALAEYLEWLSTLPGRPVFVGYPASYDFMFVYWYLIKFTGERPFSHAALDIKSLAMVALNKAYHESSKRPMPDEWFDKDRELTHIAVDDAIEQGAMFCNILKVLKALTKSSSGPSAA